MLSDTETLVGQVQDEENYFVSMTDMMVGMLFLFIILLMVFALNFRVGDDDSKRVKDCLTQLLLKNAQLSAEINKNVNAIQDSVRGQIEALELAADQRRRLLGDLRRQLGLQGLPVEVDERNGVLRLTEASINGSTLGVKRQKLVNAFQGKKDRFDLMILSPKAAGIGLNITAANHVIHLSRWWNPAVEDQCNDRVYRIGQNRPVTIHLPISVHPNLGERTFDVALDRLLERKREMSRRLLAPPVSDRDLEDVFADTISL